MVSLPDDVVCRYERYSLYNSPYPAHDLGCAVDLYPGTDVAPSPVCGEVVETQTVRCPPKPYAIDRDHLLLVDCGGVVARILHVDPYVEVGQHVNVGDPLGELVRSGFFGRWVDGHVHLGFREHDQNLRRASGSLPLTVDIEVEGVQWDGWGTVVETGPTHVRLDTPDWTGEGFAALASDEGIPLDGGLVHYAGGGVLQVDSEVLETSGGELTLLGSPIGTAEGRHLTWRDVSVSANGRAATGLSLFASRVPFGAKVVFHEGHDFVEGDRFEVTIEPTDDPVRLG